MRRIKIVDKVLLLAMSILLLLDLWLWPLGSMKYVYICYYFIRWIVIPLIRTIRKNRQNAPQ